MDQRKGDAGPIPVADIMRAIAVTMRQERGRLDGLSSFGGAGTLGTRLARAFADAADGVEGTGTGDAGEELQLAGQILSDPSNNYGRTAQYLGQGLIRAGQQLVGQSGLGLANLSTILTGLQEGAKEDNPAQPGDGTLLDVLEAAGSSYTAAAGLGLSARQVMQGLLGAAQFGVQRTATMPQPFKPNPRGTARPSSGQPDPGAAATQVMLTGLALGLLGDRVPATPAGQTNTNFLLNLLQQGIDLGGAVVTQPPVSLMESTLTGLGPQATGTRTLTATGNGVGTDVQQRHGR